MSLELSNINLNDTLQAAWLNALGGARRAQAQWEEVDGGDWFWEDDGVRVKSLTA